MCGLAGERLTLPATFFFIQLFPCGPSQNGDENRLWKTEDQLSRQRQGCLRGAALYTQKI
jgi:hypothetical protein